MIGLKKLFVKHQGLDAFELSGLRFSDLRLHGTSRIGLPSWLALVDGGRVKIYRCFGEDQARFIEWISARPEVEGAFPECLLRQDEVLVVRWLDGRAFDKRKAFRRDQRLVCQVARQQAQLHGIELSAEAPSVSLRYLGYLQDRFESYQGIMLLQSAYRRLLEDLQSLAAAKTLRVSHPDLVPQNLVARPDFESLGIIDNELLSANSYPLIDLFNTHRYFEHRRQADLVNAYLEAYARGGGDLRPLLDHEKGYLALWGLRQLGSLLQNGNLKQAQRLGRLWAKEGSQSHPIIEATKRILGE